MKVPDDRAALSASTSSIGGDLVYRLSGAPLERPRSCQLLHGRVQPYDGYASPETLQSEPIRWEGGLSRHDGRLRGRYQGGQRAFVAVECWVPELASFVRLRAERLEFP